MKLDSSSLENIFYKATYDFNKQMYDSQSQVMFSDEIFRMEFFSHVQKHYSEPLYEKSLYY